MLCVKIAGNIGDYDAALGYFDSAVEHYKKFELCRAQGSKVELQKPYYFETTFLREVSLSQYRIIVCEAAFIEYAVHSFPDNIKEQLRRNPNYACIFSESE